MPTYEFRCQKCKKSFSSRLSFKEYDSKQVKCPHCSGKDVRQLVVSVGVKTSKKS